jgi:hypothetical protein
MTKKKEVQDQVPATTKTVTISAPKFKKAVFEVSGVAPLVVHRFSTKVKAGFIKTMETGKPDSSKKKREARNTDDMYNEARYISPDGWDGFNASAIRAAMVSACRLVGFKMTLAKLSVFVEPDGWDANEPQIPLIRIYGKPVKQSDVARVETGQSYVTVRAAYHNWKSKIKIRWDADQFTIDDIYNLLYRVGMQVGICEGRPDSKKSCGMGWGLFEVNSGEIHEIN